MRRHYIDEENLTYADGLAAGETIKVLHEGREKGASAGPLRRSRNWHASASGIPDGADNVF